MGGVKAFLRDLILQLLVLLIAGYLGLLFSIDISSLLGIQELLWSNGLILVLIVIGVLVVTRQILVMRHVRRVSQIGIYGVKRRPEYVARKFKGVFYGVVWRVLFGSEIFAVESPYVFVEPYPYCPNCDYELDDRTKSGFLGLAIKHVWHCSQCKRDYPRGRDYPDESDVIEKRVEAWIRSGSITLQENELFEEIK